LTIATWIRTLRLTTCMLKEIKMPGRKTNKKMPKKMGIGGKSAKKMPMKMKRGGSTRSRSKSKK